jgi:hypothetical protein
LGLDRAGNLFVPGCPERVLFAAVLIWISFDWDVFARSALALLEWIGSLLIMPSSGVSPSGRFQAVSACRTCRRKAIKRQRLQPSGGYNSQ